MPPPDRRALDRYRTLLQRRRALVAAVMTKAWDDLDSHDEDDVDRFARAVVPTLAGAKTATVAAATAFVALQLRMRPPAVSAASVAVVADLRAPFAAYWHG